MMQNHDKSPMQVGPLIPFCCQYTMDGGIYGITLYGLTEKQVIKDNSDHLADLKVLGVTHEIIPVPKGQ